MKNIKDLLNISFNFTQGVEISIQDILILIVVLIVANVLLRLIRKLMTRRMPDDDKLKFKAVFSYGKWFVYVIIFLITLHSVLLNASITLPIPKLLPGIGLEANTTVSVESSSI